MTKDSNIQATTYGALSTEDHSAQNSQSAGDENAKISASHLKLKQLSALRNATAPRDKTLDKTLDLPREERLGKPLPLPDSGSYGTIEDPLYEADLAKSPNPVHRLYLATLDTLILALTKLRGD